MSAASPSGTARAIEAAALARAQARLAAVQALYQMDLAQTDLAEVLHEFKTVRFGAQAEDQTIALADPDLFAEVVRGVVARQREIDPPLDQQLAAGWRLQRIDSIVRAILRSATFELMGRPGAPARSIISEYVDIAKAFFEGDEPKVVNAVLDKLARKIRTAEFSGG
jgi:N utilization substance protein B